MSFEYTTADGRLTVYEVSDGYHLRLNDRCGSPVVGLGDGVDWYFDELGRAIWAGTDELHQAIIVDIEQNENEWVEAYFGLDDDYDNSGIEICPQCGASCKDDVTIADHGVCHDCLREQLMGSGELLEEED